jgi:hypothetical protein
VSNNTALQQLGVSGNQLTEIDVSKNAALRELYIGDSNLTTLDVSNNLALRELHAWRSNLTTLDVSSNTALTTLNVGQNQLTELDVSINTALTWLNVWDNNLTTFNVLSNTALITLNAGQNQLTEIDVSNNIALRDLNVQLNNLTALDVSNNTALESLNISGNKFNTLDVSNNIALRDLSVWSNELSELDLSNNPALRDLYFSNNAFTDISFLEDFENLRHVDVRWNRLDLDCDDVNASIAKIQATVAANDGTFQYGSQNACNSSWCGDCDGAISRNCSIPNCCVGSFEWCQGSCWKCGECLAACLLAGNHCVCNDCFFCGDCLRSGGCCDADDCVCLASCECEIGDGVRERDGISLQGYQFCGAIINVKDAGLVVGESYTIIYAVRSYGTTGFRVRYTDGIGWGGSGAYGDADFNLMGNAMLIAPRNGWVIGQDYRLTFTVTAGESGIAPGFRVRYNRDIDSWSPFDGDGGPTEFTAFDPATGTVGTHAGGISAWFPSIDRGQLNGVDMTTPAMKPGDTQTFTVDFTFGDNVSGDDAYALNAIGIYGDIGYSDFTFDNVVLYTKEADNYNYLGNYIHFTGGFNYNDSNDAGGYSAHSSPGATADGTRASQIPAFFPQNTIAPNSVAHLRVDFTLGEDIAGLDPLYMDYIGFFGQWGGQDYEVIGVTILDKNGDTVSSVGDMREGCHTVCGACGGMNGFNSHCEHLNNIPWCAGWCSTHNGCRSLCSEMNEYEVQKLTAFALQGDNLGKLGWDLSDPLSWEGINWRRDNANCRFNVRGINFWDSGLTGDLDVSGFTSLSWLSVAYHNCCCNGYSGGITSLDASGCIELRTFEVIYNRLTDVNLSGSTSLEGIYIQDNNLTNLDFLDGLTNLRYVDIRNNNLNLNNTGIRNTIDNLIDIVLSNDLYRGYLRFSPQKNNSSYDVCAGAHTLIRFNAIAEKCVRCGEWFYASSANAEDLVFEITPEEFQSFADNNGISRYLYNYNASTFVYIPGEGVKISAPNSIAGNVEFRIGEVRLPNGRYTLEVEFASEEPTQFSIRSWDRIFVQSDEDVISATLTIDFTTRGNGHFADGDYWFWGIRLFSEVSNDYTIKSIKIFYDYSCEIEGCDWDGNDCTVCGAWKQCSDHNWVIEEEGEHFIDFRCTVCNTWWFAPKCSDGGIEHDWVVSNVIYDLNGNILGYDYRCRDCPHTQRVYIPWLTCRIIYCTDCDGITNRVCGCGDCDIYESTHMCRCCTVWVCWRDNCNDIRGYTCGCGECDYSNAEWCQCCFIYECGDCGKYHSDADCRCDGVCGFDKDDTCVCCDHDWWFCNDCDKLNRHWQKEWYCRCGDCDYENEERCECIPSWQRCPEGGAHDWVIIRRSFYSEHSYCSKCGEGNIPGVAGGGGGGCQVQYCEQGGGIYRIWCSCGECDFSNEVWCHIGGRHCDNSDNACDNCWKLSCICCRFCGELDCDCKLIPGDLFIDLFDIGAAEEYANDGGMDSLEWLKHVGRGDVSWINGEIWFTNRPHSYSGVDVRFENLPPGMYMLEVGVKTNGDVPIVLDRARGPWGQGGHEFAVFDGKEGKLTWFFEWDGERFTQGSYSADSVRIQTMTCPYNGPEMDSPDFAITSIKIYLVEIGQGVFCEDCTFTNYTGNTATCTTAGTETAICNTPGCDETHTRDTAALGHNWGTWGNNTATATMPGTETRSCTRPGCTHSETRPTPALNAPQITISNTTPAIARKDDTFTIDVGINNNPGITFIQFRFEFDNTMLELINVQSIGGSVLEGFSFGGMNAMTIENANTNGFGLVSWQEGMIDSNNNGMILRLTFKALETGNADISVMLGGTSNNNANNVNEERIPFAPSGKSISVIDVLIGDINGDGEIDGLDITRLIQYVNGWPVSISSLIAADVNGDGEIDGLDITRLIQFVNGWSVTLGPS